MEHLFGSSFCTPFSESNEITEEYACFGIETSNGMLLVCREDSHGSTLLSMAGKISAPDVFVRGLDHFLFCLLFLVELLADFLGKEGRH